MIITMNELNRLYAEKLLETGSHDKALLKVCWVAFCHGKDGDVLESGNYPEYAPIYDRTVKPYRMGSGNLKTQTGDI
jgi:hypothetical protein